MRSSYTHLLAVNNKIYLNESPGVKDEHTIKDQNMILGHEMLLQNSVNAISSDSFLLFQNVERFELL